MPSLFRATTSCALGPKPVSSRHSAPSAWGRACQLQGRCRRPLLVVPCASSSNSSSSHVDYYALLGLEPSASMEDIRGAYRRRALQQHPDVNKSPTASEEFIALRRAYATLSTPELRAEHDSKLGVPSARARDPRFARFERWRSEVVPDLLITLDYWGREINGMLSAWRDAVQQREAQLHALQAELQQTLRRLTQLVLALAAVAEAAGGSRSDSSSAAVPSWQAAAQKHQPAPALDAAGDAGSGAATSEQQQRQEEEEEAAAARELLAIGCQLLQQLRAAQEGLVLDVGDGEARVRRQVDKRYEQVSVRYPAYPAIVWYDVWEEASDNWLLRCEQQVRAGTADAARWARNIDELEAEVQQAAAACTAKGIQVPVTERVLA